MRTLFSAVAVGAIALGFTACSQDVAGPTPDPLFARGGIAQMDTTTSHSDSITLAHCAWDGGCNRTSHNNKSR